MISRKHQGRDTFQEFDQVALFKPICKQSIVVPEAHRLPELLNDAIRLATSGRCGPVVLHVAHDIVGETFDMEAVSPPSPVEAAAPTASQIEQMVILLSQAKAPVIFAGSGFKSEHGSATLQALATTLNIPVVASTGPVSYTHLTLPTNREV